MRKRYFVVVLLSALLIGVASLVNAQPANQRPAPPRVASSTFEFGLIGDLPYTPEQEAKFPNLIADLNQAELAFVVHDGDFKSGSTLCNDETFYQRRDLFQTSEHPFIFIPGDNEWTDCHRENNGSYDPIERLTKLREIFFQGRESLGQQTLPLSRQSSNSQYRKFGENVRWAHGNVMFVGLNVTGSNNNFGRTPEADTEYAERNAANLAWVEESFTLAKQEGAAGIMLLIQANPGFELPATDPERTGFNDFLAQLETETLDFEKPVVLVHGDSHYFRIDKPLVSAASDRRIENFTRVETFGSPDVHWLRARVDLNNPRLFSFSEEIVPENLVDHQP